MRPGSVIVDLAVGRRRQLRGDRARRAASSPRTASRILGCNNWPGRIPVAASALYARNLLTFLTTFWDKEAKAPKLPEADDIVKGVMLTRGGAVVHPNFLPAQAA